MLVANAWRHEIGCVVGCCTHVLHLAVNQGVCKPLGMRHVDIIVPTVLSDVCGLHEPQYGHSDVICSVM